MDKRLYVVAGYDEETEARLSRLRQHLMDAGFIGTQTADVPHHITLGSFDVSMEEELKETLCLVCRNTARIKVSFSHLGIFGGSRVLFVAPDANTRLLRLKEEFGDSFHWTAHTTMLIDEPDAIFRALPIIAREFTSFCGYVDSLYLYEFFPKRFIRREMLIRTE